MTLAETALDEGAATQLGGPRFPKPGKYDVRSTGAPLQVPLNGVISLAFAPEGVVLKINDVVKGPVIPLGNGDFKVEYTSGDFDLVLQFRQSDTDFYLYGVSMPLVVEPRAADDPPITGVWGAEARPGGTTEPEK